MGSSGRLLGLVLLLTTLVGPGQQRARAELYACVDGRGRIQYTNAPAWSTCRALNEGLQQTKARVAPPLFSPTLATDQYDQEITRAGQLYHLDPRLIKAIIQTESNFNPYALSPKGARGLMQLMPATAIELQIDNSFDPWQNIAGGSRYFRELLNRFDNQLGLALAAYNAGPKRVEATGAIPELTETKEYVRKVLLLFRSFQQETMPAPLALNH